MVGVTLSLGGVAAGLMINQFELATTAAADGGAIHVRTAGTQVSFVYAAIGPDPACPTYRGVQGGSVLAITLFDYGTTSFTPRTVVVNGTIYHSSSFPTTGEGELGTYDVTLAPRGQCAHPWGQSVLMADAYGDEFRFET